MTSFPLQWKIISIKVHSSSSTVLKEILLLMITLGEILSVRNQKKHGYHRYTCRLYIFTTVELESKH